MILYAAGRIMKRKAKTFRMILSSFIGSLFALTLFIGVRPFLLSLAIKVTSTLVITLIAYRYDSFKELLKISSAVFIVSTAFSGMMIALYQLCRPPNMVIVNDVVYFEINPLVLVAITGTIYLIFYLIELLLRERIKASVVRLSFTVQGRTYSCIGKIDTGCNLTEPFSKSPVIIVDPSVFPIANTDRCRVIPYTTVSGSSILYAVKAERVTINDTDILQDIYIASGDITHNDYRAVINSDIIR